MKKGPSSRMFMIELIICCLFFIISMAICLKLFAHAREVSDGAAALSVATLKAQEAAEVYEEFDGDLEKTAKLLGGSTVDGILSLGYDRDWMPGGVAYSLTLTPVTSGALTRADIAVYDSAGLIFELSSLSCFDGEVAK